jgi:hypothetical protein
MPRFTNNAYDGIIPFKVLAVPIRRGHEVFQEIFGMAPALDSFLWQKPKKPSRGFTWVQASRQNGPSFRALVPLAHARFSEYEPLENDRLFRDFAMIKARSEQGEEEEPKSTEQRLSQRRSIESIKNEKLERRILYFANRFGSLGGDLPAGLGISVFARYASTGDKTIAGYVEPFDVWEACVWQFAGLLRRWDAIEDGPGPGDSPERGRLLELLNGQLQRFISPVLIQDTATANRPINLWGAILLQFAQSISGDSTWRYCQLCPERIRGRSDKKYCSACKKKAYRNRAKARAANVLPNGPDNGEFR